MAYEGNPYEELSVAKGASADDIKKAYRKAAMQFHPDRNPGNAAAEQKFKDIGAAYAILKDDQNRAAYDRFGHASEQTVSAGQGSHTATAPQPWSSTGDPGKDWAAVSVEGFMDGYNRIYNQYLNYDILYQRRGPDEDLLKAIEAKPQWAEIRLRVILNEMKGEHAAHCSDDMRAMFNQYIPGIYAAKVAGYRVGRYAKNGWDVEEVVKIIQESPTLASPIFGRIGDGRIMKGDDRVWNLLVPHMSDALSGKLDSNNEHRVETIVLNLVKAFNESLDSRGSAVRIFDQDLYPEPIARKLLSLAAQSLQAIAIINQNITDRRYVFRQNILNDFREKMDAITRSSTADVHAGTSQEAPEPSR